MPPIPSGNQLVATFRSFEWVSYVWGGSSPGTGWDCSGACNWVVAERWLLSIPGHVAGTWTSAQGHGPVVADWIAWGGVTLGMFGPVQPLPGDLIAWGPNQHMGMAIDNTRFVSAANPQQGTIEADIGTFFNWAPFVLRLRQVSLTGSTTLGIPQPTPLPPDPMTNWAGSIRTAAGHGNSAAANLSRFASVIRHT